MKKEEHNFGHGAALLLVSAIIVKLAGALFKIPLSSKICLGDLGFGYFSAVYDLFTPIYSLAMAGLPVAVAKVVSSAYSEQRYIDLKDVFSKSKKVCLIFGLVGFFAILILCKPYVLFTGQKGNLVFAIMTLAPAMFFCCVMSVYRGFYEGLQNMFPTALSEITEAMGKLVLGFIFAFLTIKFTGDPSLGAAAAMLGIMVGTGLAFAVLLIYHRKKQSEKKLDELSKNSQNDKGGITAKQILLIALPVALASVSSGIPSMIDSLTVEWRLSGIAESIRLSGLPTDISTVSAFLYGIRAKAYTVCNLVPAFTTVIAVAVVPSISSAMALCDKNSLKKSVNSALKLSSVISFPAAAGFIFIGRRIMALLFDTKASTDIGGRMLILYGVSTFFSGICIVLTGILQGAGKQNRAIINIIIGVAVKTAVNIAAVGVLKINIFGAAAGTVAFWATVCILNFVFTVKYLKLMPDIKNTVLKPLISAVLCGVSAYAVCLLNGGKTVTALAVLTGGLVYFISLLAMKTFTEEDYFFVKAKDVIIKFCQKHRKIA